MSKKMHFAVSGGQRVYNTILKGQSIDPVSMLRHNKAVLANQRADYMLAGQRSLEAILGAMAHRPTLQAGLNVEVLYEDIEAGLGLHPGELKKYLINNRITAPFMEQFAGNEAARTYADGAMKLLLILLGIATLTAVSGCTTPSGYTLNPDMAGNTLGGTTDCNEYAKIKVDEKGNEVTGKPGLDVIMDNQCHTQIENQKKENKTASADDPQLGLGAATGETGAELDAAYKDIVVGGVQLGTPSLLWKYNETESKNIKAMAVYGQGDDFFVLIDKRDGADLDKEPARVYFGISNAAVEVNVGIYGSRLVVGDVKTGGLMNTPNAPVISGYKDNLRLVSAENKELVHFLGLKKFLSEGISVNSDYVYGLDFAFDEYSMDTRPSKSIDGPTVKQQLFS